MDMNNHTKQARKILVLTHYGNSKCACVHCGYTDIRALSIDHIKGGGTQHCISLNKHGDGFYLWLVRQGFPEGYQTLCMNCQWVKRWDDLDWQPPTPKEVQQQYKQYFPRR
jgi:hypothetical protein